MEATEASKKRRLFTKCRWTIVEDNHLTELVARYGAGNWDCIARVIQSRNAKSCRLRWLNHLSPAVNKSPFTDVENARLLRLQRDLGNKWSAMVHFFTGRTDNQLKNQYHYLVKTRSFEASVQYASIDGHSSLFRGTVNRNSSAVIASSLSADPHHVENNYRVYFPGKPCNNPSSMYARDENSCAGSSEGVNLGNVRGYDVTRTKDSTRYDPNSRVILDLFPMSKQKRSSKNAEVIDFMGVGSSK